MHSPIGEQVISNNMTVTSSRAPNNHPYINPAPAPSPTTITDSFDRAEVRAAAAGNFNTATAAKSPNSAYVYMERASTNPLIVRHRKPRQSVAAVVLLGLQLPGHARADMRRRYRIIVTKILTKGWIKDSANNLKNGHKTMVSLTVR